MNETTEIRKLSPSNVRALSHMLEENESWKKLMAIIPKKLEKHNYECSITIDNLHKYRSEHFKLIEHEHTSLKTRSCTEILFDEWGTSGRIRPALGHLLYLLIKAELFRAADYVAVTLLKKNPPPRPFTGPAALVNTTLSEVHNPRLQEVEQILDKMDYPSSIISNLTNQSIDVNLNHCSQSSPTIPKIVISETMEYKTNTPFGIPVVVENRKPRIVRQNASTEDENSNTTVSDMMKFSHSEISTDFSNINVMPNISELMSSNIQNQMSENVSVNGNSIGLPVLSALNLNSEALTCSKQNVPALSELMSANQDLPHISDLLETSNPVHQEEFLPQISLLNPGSDAVDRNSTSQVSINVVECDRSNSVPQFSALLSDNKGLDNSSSKHFLPIRDNELSDTSSFASSKNSNANSEVSRSSNLSQRSNPTCVSPLPNLNLNTPLPHFSYVDIEVTTNSFDETPHKNCRQVENPLAKTNGRFLGSGAFGSVFLGLNLTEKPVAVKKLFLKDVDIVDVDNTVTKQFRNEVEVLSKYKHENLLSLVGYSCDGPTYCLIYEFIPGGALKDRLQNEDEKLIWTDRLYIALGTARAINYLHTAYSVPLIHRDIKTANILLDCTNKPKLCDFGLIKLLPSQNTSTSTTAFGTSAYMAREAFRGDVSVKLDTFSFGVVLLELITGLPPLDENREGYDIVTHVDEVCEDTGIIPLIDGKAGSWIAKGINFAEELYKISLKCLEQNKRKRPTMVEVTDQLSELIKESS